MSAEEVVRMRARRSAVKHLATLRELCLQNIADNLETFCHGEVLIFKDLPRSVMTDLIKLLQRLSLLTARYLPHLICSNTEVLQLYQCTLGPYVENDVNYLSSLIKIRSQASLKSLTLWCASPALEVLKDTLSGLKNLQKLDLSIHTVDLQVMAVIGAHLTQLRELKLSNNSGVTNEGMRYLCDATTTGSSLGKCKNLIHLDVQRTSVDTEGLIMALINLPQLQQLEHRKIQDALEILHHQQQLNHCYRTLRLSSVELKIELMDNIEKLIPVMCPNIRRIKVVITSESADMKLEPLLKLPPSQITHLFLINRIYDTVLLNAVLAHHQFSITHLEICDFDISAIDLIKISQCPNLKTLVLSRYRSRNFNTYNLSNINFQSLESISIYDTWPSHFPWKFLQKSMMSLNLESFQITRISNFTDTLLESVLKECKSDERVLSKLRHVRMSECNNITAKHLKTLIAYAPRLKFLTVKSCESIHSRDLTDLKLFVSTHGLQIKI